MRACLRFATVATVTCMIGSVISAAAPDGLARQGPGLHQADRTSPYRVNPDVVSVRFAAPMRTFDDFLEAVAVLPDADPAAWAGFEMVRCNELNICDIRTPPRFDAHRAVEAFRDTGLVEFAELNTYGRYLGAPDDPEFAVQWALHNTGQTGGLPGADVHAVEAWSITSGDPSIVIAVVDSGTDIDHVDLLANLWKNAGEIPDNGLDDDGNGFVDDYDGWDFANDDNDPIGPNPHGTMVAGIVGAATNNGVGIAGLAGGWGAEPGCRLMPLAVGDFLPDGSVLDDAILYAADHGASIITLSLTVGQTQALDEALEYARSQRDVFIDCAAGNDHLDVTYPASHPAVMAVGATDHADEPAGFSNIGPELEVAAPGVDVRSTTIGDAYDTSSGTSFAAPHAAALAGLVLSRAPWLTNEDVRLLMMDTADDVGLPGFDWVTGHGRINAHAALQAIADACAWDCESVPDGAVDIDDLVAVINHWGACADPGNCPWDCEETPDGQVDIDDLVAIINHWGPCP